MLRLVRKLYEPVLFQGDRLLGRPSPYFEGWYFKAVFPGASYALIPGVSLAAPDAHGFIQVIDGASGRSRYERFALEDFACDRRRFLIRFGANRFSLDGLDVDLEGFRASLRIIGARPWPASLLSPSSMGWYAFMRFMECYHGIIVLDAAVEGQVNGRSLRGGRFYLEKDWGSSFPRAWVWMQSNTFSGRQAGVSLTCSVARVPFRGREFTGFIIGLLADGRLHAFTTYNGARVTGIRFDDTAVQIEARRRDFTLRLRASRELGVPLASPVAGAMQGRIEETLGARIQVHLEQGGRTLFAGRGTDAGLEVVQPAELLRGVEARRRDGRGRGRKAPPQRR